MLAFAIGNTLPKTVRASFRWAMLARLSVSVANVALEGQMIGADADAQGFFNRAVERSSNLESLSWDILELFDGSNGFINVHALLQGLLGGPDFFLSHAFSLLGAAGCLVVLAKTWLLLFPQNNQGLARLLLIYSFTPSVLTNQSYILREVWQSLCINGLAWLGVAIQVRGWSFGRVIGLLLFTLVGCFLHNAMPVAIPTLLILSLMLANKVSTTNLLRSPANIFKTTLLVIIFIAITFPLLSQSALFTSWQKGSLLEQAEVYSINGLQSARAEYGNLFQASQPWTIVPTFLAYQLMPIPGQIANIADVILFAENFLRLALLWLYWQKRKSLSSSQRNNCDVLLLMWFIMELIWSTGTINWGTAARHHIAAYGLLLICGLSKEFRRDPNKSKFAPVNQYRRTPTKNL